MHAASSPRMTLALAEGVGAVTVDGKMIDVPVVERARSLIEREAAIAAREATKPRVDS
jgi:citrate lyase beta subunit